MMCGQVEKVRSGQVRSGRQGIRAAFPDLPGSWVVVGSQWKREVGVGRSESQKESGRRSTRLLVFVGVKTVSGLLDSNGDPPTSH